MFLKSTGEFRGLIRTFFIKVFQLGFEKEDNIYLIIFQAIVLRYGGALYAESIGNYTKNHPQIRRIFSIFLFIGYLIYSINEINKSYKENKINKSKFYYLILGNIIFASVVIYILCNNEDETISKTENILGM